MVSLLLGPPGGILDIQSCRFEVGQVFFSPPRLSPAGSCRRKLAGGSAHPPTPQNIRDTTLVVSLIFCPPGGILDIQSCRFEVGQVFFSSPRLSPADSCRRKLAGGSAHPPTPQSKRDTTDVVSLLLGPPGGIRTPGLWNRNPLRYPASPRADIPVPRKHWLIIHRNTDKCKRNFEVFCISGEQSRPRRRFFRSASAPIAFHRKNAG